MCLVVCMEAGFSQIWSHIAVYILANYIVHCNKKVSYVLIQCDKCN